ncbi:hypothetical protein MKY14_23565 [Paenibacillus sp. FSL R5-0887]|uniref:Uncharacterized protein n=1 Tax=Paenibacillus odorifer TaxID=189426 RepID=A0ABX3GIY5_9BACL|nr:hypothetical protein [Paenibacillus odorifer]OMD15603.1 hypothetical protein BSO21_27455 [Paenibacillus odorifer]OMD76037.1 hypothetical protein BSK50_17350 [Paenibacillus odorifer]OMD88387.1 hypothetical protein BSK49_15475 [Paenibacillus odorifer]
MKKRIISIMVVAMLIFIPINADAMNVNQNETDFKAIVAGISVNETAIMSIDEVPEITINWLREQGAAVNEDSAIQFVPATQNIATMRSGEINGEAIRIWNELDDGDISVNTILPISQANIINKIIEAGKPTGTPGTVGYGLSSVSIFTAHADAYNNVTYIRPLRQEVTAYANNGFNINNFTATWVTLGTLLTYPGYTAASEANDFPFRHEIVTSVSSPVMGTKYTGYNALGSNRVFLVGGGLAWACGVVYDINVNGNIQHFEVTGIL